MIQDATKSESTSSLGYTNFQVTALVALRILIGWHFLYEGLAKILNPYWTSAGYLAESQWWFRGFFLFLATSPGMLAVVDVLNSWGLVLIGLGLMLGCLTRSATVAGMVLLLLYYIAAPPFVGYQYTLPAEGSYLIVNKVLIELVALSVLFTFPTGKLFGLDKLIPWNTNPAYKALKRAHA
jgi:thiosulfate dehydrogenase [quinone] large subunit